MTDPKSGDGLACTEDKLVLEDRPTAPMSVDMSGTDLPGALCSPSGSIGHRPLNLPGGCRI